MIVSSQNNPPADRRQEMIDETSAFITWALANPEKVPRLPVRSVNSGGFDGITRSASANKLIAGFWNRAISVIDALRW